MHCCGGVFFFICPRQPGRPGSRLDWAGIGWRDTAFWCNDLIRPRGFTGAFVASLFFPITWLEARGVACSTRCREYRRRVCRLNLFLSLSLFADVPSCVGAALALACTASLSLD